MEKFELPHRHGSMRHLEDIHRMLSHADHFDAAAELFRQLSDPTRVRIFWVLCHREECVINLAAMFFMSSPAVSHHLRSLSECGLIVSRRDGKEAYYKAADTEEAQLLHVVVERTMEVACPEKAVDFGAPKEEIIHKVHEYLMEHISEHVTIEELSKIFLMNMTTLKKDYRQVYGTSIAEHVKMARMAKAAELLTGTKEPIAAVARAVGYESQSRFSAAFRKIYGKLPLEYRRGDTHSSVF